MARVNIEEDAWVRIYKLAALMGISPREAAGVAVCLWHQSQSYIKTTGTLEDILDWTNLNEISEEEAKKWILNLKKSRLISSANDKEFIINGNEVQIESRLSRQKRATKGAKALNKKLKEEKKKTRTLEARLEHAPSTLEARLERTKTRQDKAKQDKAKQEILVISGENSENYADLTNDEKVSIKEKQKSAEDLTQAKALRSATWQVFYAGYVKRYKVEPVKNKKINSQIKMLVERLGKDAPDVVGFYLTHPKAYYVSRMHDIGCCLSDAEALRTQWLRGKAVTENDIKRYSKNQEQQDLIDAIDRGEV